MDGENNGNPYFLMDDLGVPLFLETPICWARKQGVFIIQFSSLHHLEVRHDKKYLWKKTSHSQLQMGVS